MSTAFFSKLNLEQPSSNPAEPAWLISLREEAVGRLLDEGLPTSKTEAWRYTGLRALLDVPFARAETSAADSACVQWAEDILGDDDTQRVYVVNGRPLDLEGVAEGFEVLSLAKVLAETPEKIQSYLTRHAHSEHFGALNSALFTDGLSVRLAANAQPSKTLHIVHISAPGAGPTACYPRLVIVGGVHASFSIIETYLAQPGAADLCTAVTEVCLEDGATFDHLRVIEGNDTSSHIGTLAVHQKRNSKYQSRSVVMGGKLSRLEIDARMTGPGAECSLDGMYHAVGSEHVAHHTLVTHEASNCSSNEEYRGLVDDRAHAVFDGIIVVQRDTKNTCAHQQTHNLLLSDSATVNTKPHLEIDSDDLTASHGATIGALDPAQLFFLRARGIGENEACSILTLSFVRSILERISSQRVRERLVRRVLARLPHGADIAEISL